MCSKVNAISHTRGCEAAKEDDRSNSMSNLLYSIRCEVLSGRDEGMGTVGRED